MDLSVDLNRGQNLSLDLTAGSHRLSLNPIPSKIQVVAIKVNTTAYWNSLIGFVPKKGELIVYSDYAQSQSGQNIPALKVGDGNAYLIDIPFVSGGVSSEVIDLIMAHIRNGSIHVTQSEKEFWGSKVSCNLDGENLVFTTLQRNEG